MHATGVDPATAEPPAGVPVAGDLAPDPATASAAYAALRRWGAARDAVLRELVHTLSNRVGTVLAASGMLDAGSAAVVGRVLGGETEQLETLLAQFRLVTADPFGDDAVPEPVILAGVVADAVALHASVGERGDAAVTLRGVDDAPPVLVSRVGLLHALLIVLSAAGRTEIVLRADIEASGAVRLRVEPLLSDDATAAARWLLATSRVQLDAGGAMLLPRFGEGVR